MHSQAISNDSVMSALWLSKVQQSNKNYSATTQAENVAYITKARGQQTYFMGLLVMRT